MKVGVEGERVLKSMFRKVGKTLPREPCRMGKGREELAAAVVVVVVGCRVISCPSEVPSLLNEPWSMTASAELC